MNKLPGGYIAVTYLARRQSTSIPIYFDTGIVPSNDLDINALIHTGFQNDLTAYFFGARNTNSNTSVGQLNFERRNQNLNVGYINKETTIDNVTLGKVSIQKDDINFTTYSSSGVKQFIGATTSFTGARTMYILAVNNAGNPLVSNGFAGIYAMTISRNGELLKDYCACYDVANDKYGLYDFVADEFVNWIGNQTANPFANTCLLQVQGDGNGSGLIRSYNAGLVDKIYVTYMSGTIYTPYTDNYVQVVAQANDGYVFKAWVNENNEVVSTDQESVIEVTDNMTLTATFEKMSSVYQDNIFQTLGLEYGVGDITGTDGMRSNYFAKLLSASIQEDIMSKTVSDLVVDNVPSTYIPNMPICILNQKGKLLYAGTIESIEGNTLHCREPLAIVDNEMVLDENTYRPVDSINIYASHVAQAFATGKSKLSSGYTIDGTVYNDCVRRMCAPYKFDADNFIWFNVANNNPYNAPPIDEVNIGSVEDYIFELCNDFIIVFKPSLYTDGATKKTYLKLTSVNPYISEILTFGNNSEEISNVSVETQGMEYTTLLIYNSAMTSNRGKGWYGVKTDRSIGFVPLGQLFDDSFIGYRDCKPKIVASDEPIPTIVAQNLSSGFYNHKITMTVDLTKDTFKLEDFELGRQVDFYYGSRLYRSIITSRSYELRGDVNGVKSVVITLGKVRNDLTSKLNLGKVK